MRFYKNLNIDYILRFLHGFSGDAMLGCLVDQLGLFLGINQMLCTTSPLLGVTNVHPFC